MATNEYRQGDVYLRRIDAVPSGAQKKDNVLAYGEATGHKHQVQDGDVLIKDGRQFVIARQKTKLVHEEHEEIELPQGIYEVLHQREFSPQENRRVSD